MEVQDESRSGKQWKEVFADASVFGLRAIFRGQGAGMTKAILRLTLFHEGRHLLEEAFRQYNRTGFLRYERSPL